MSENTKAKNTGKTINMERLADAGKEGIWQPPKEVHGLPVIAGNATANVVFVTAAVKVAGVDFTINFGKSRKISDERAVFLPAKVFKAGEKAPVWDFSEEKKSGATIAYLFLYVNPARDAEYVIGVIGKPEKRFEITKVILLADLGRISIKRPDGSIVRIGGLSEEEILNLKMDVAKQIGWAYHLTSTEREIIRVREIERGAVDKEKHEGLVREQDARQKAREERRQQAEALRKEIMARESVTVYTAEGRPLSARPVTESEWRCLGHDTKVVLFKKIEGGHPVDDPVEAFTVQKDKKARKKGGAAKGWRSGEVFWEKPTASNILTDEDGKDLWFIVGEQRERQPVFSMVTIKQLHEQGVNGGTLFVVNEPDARNRYPVVSLSKKGIKEVGRYQAVQ